MISRLALLGQHALRSGEAQSSLLQRAVFSTHAMRSALPPPAGGCVLTFSLKPRYKPGPFLSRVLKPTSVFLLGSSAAFITAGLAKDRGMARAWQEASAEQRLVWGLIATNAAVWLLWKVPAYGPTLLRNSVLALPPLATRAHTMLSSSFSHIHFNHLAFNMMALHSFGPLVAAAMGPWQFAAFYVSAGLASSAASVLGRVVTGRLAGGMSLGASGAVYACFASSALMYPDSQSALIFLPMFPIDTGTALKGAVCLDALGALLGWRWLDHFGHLGGAAFGCWYTLYGHQQWMALRRRMQEQQGPGKW